MEPKEVAEVAWVAFLAISGFVTVGLLVLVWLLHVLHVVREMQRRQELEAMALDGMQQTLAGHKAVLDSLVAHLMLAPEDERSETDSVM